MPAIGITVYPSLFSMPRKTHAILHPSGIHNVPRPVTMTTEFIVNVMAVRREVVYSNKVATKVFDIATGINTIQLSPKYDHPL